MILGMGKADLATNCGPMCHLSWYRVSSPDHWFWHLLSSVMVLGIRKAVLGPRPGPGPKTPFLIPRTITGDIWHHSKCPGPSQDQSWAFFSPRTAFLIPKTITSDIISLPLLAMAISQWIHQFSSDHWSQALSGPVSIWMGDGNTRCCWHPLHCTILQLLCHQADKINSLLWQWPNHIEYTSYYLGRRHEVNGPCLSSPGSKVIFTVGEAVRSTCGKSEEKKEERFHIFLLQTILWPYTSYLWVPPRVPRQLMLILGKWPYNSYF